MECEWRMGSGLEHGNEPGVEFTDKNAVYQGDGIAVWWIARGMGSVAVTDIEAGSAAAAPDGSRTRWV